MCSCTVLFPILNLAGFMILTNCCNHCIVFSRSCFNPSNPSDCIHTTIHLHTWDNRVALLPNPIHKSKSVCCHKAWIRVNKLMLHLVAYTGLRMHVKLTLREAVLQNRCSVRHGYDLRSEHTQKTTRAVFLASSDDQVEWESPLHATRDGTERTGTERNATARNANAK